MVPSSLPQSMRAHLLEEFNTDYVLREVPVPTITNPNDILLHVDAASYCHTDAVLSSGAMHPPFPPSLPHVNCHEFAGTVVGLHQQAASSSNQRFKIGDRVAVSGRGYHSCGSCFECRKPSGPDADDPGYSVYCPRSTGLGMSELGGFQEYTLADARQVELIPPNMTAVEVAPLMCAGLTVFAALKRCNLQPGQRVGIMGVGGGLGHLGLQFAVKMGLKVVGVDVSPQGLQLARELGNDEAVIVDASETAAEDVRRNTGASDGREYLQEMGCDAVLVLPESQRSFDYAIKLLKDGGLAVLLSFPKDGFHLPAYDVVFRQIRLEGSLIGSNKALREMLDFCAEHSVKAKIRTYEFERLNELAKDYEAGTGGKLVLDFSKK